MIRIIADDLGLEKSVNDGIIFLLREGKIDGASLMANGEAFNDAAEKIGSVDNPNIGIHFVLVEEKPLTKIILPKNHKIFFLKYIFGLIKLSEIEKEMRAQLNKIINAGIAPQFINSHQHLHLLPGVINLAVRLAVEYNIPYIRTINEPVSFSGGKFFRKIQLLFLNLLSAAAKKKIRGAGLYCNDFFIGFVNAGNLGERDVKQAEKSVKEYPDKVVELGCHPGYENEALIEKYKHWGPYRWQNELVVLKELKRP